MTDTRLWDRAALPAVDGRRLPEVPALDAGLPTVPDLFDFMRDAEARFATLRMRILERSMTTRGEVETQMDVTLRHPGQAKVMTSQPGQVIGGAYEIWVSDGDLVRTYAAAHKLGTQRPIRNRPRGLADDDFPGTAQVYEPVSLSAGRDPPRDLRPSSRVLPERPVHRSLHDHRDRAHPRSRGHPAASAITPGPWSSRETDRTTGSRSRSIGRWASSCAWSRRSAAR
ncbi:MAG: hypothetical protein WKF78_10350 [Candidatus Limnocylindrales bacterium]